MPERRVVSDREIQRRIGKLRRSIGVDVERMRIDSATTLAHLASVARLDRSFVGRIESGDANPSLETLMTLAIALGADLSVKFYPGTGPRLTDRHQSRMVEAVLQRLAPAWRPHLEVPVSRPFRGVIDVVFERLGERRFVVSEAYSTVARLEQQIRWSADKAASLGSWSLVEPGSEWTSSRLLILRSTAANRDLARTFESTLHTAYPAKTRDAARSLTGGEPWPGDAIIWVRIDGDRVELMDAPPRGVSVGR
jgi:transcriptional regulator with XRE-family HTH domain